MKRWPSRTPHGVGVGLLILFTCCVARRVQRKLPPNVAYSLLTKAERAKITAVEKWASSLGATSNIKSKNLKVVTGSFYIVGEVAGILEEEALI